MTDAINFTAPPTCAAFMKSDKFGRLIAGPVGSGKTTACMFELLRRAFEQPPAPDGFRYTRFAILRQTLSQLKQTVLKDIMHWLNQLVTYKVTENTIYITIGDVKSEWIMIPLEDVQDQRRLLSMQLTGAWISECIEIDFNLVPAIAGRCGRYPQANMGGASWFGIIADTNMPTEGSDWYKFMTNAPEDWGIFIQPSGLSPEAENLDWLTQTTETLKLPLGSAERRAQGRRYYERLERSNSPDWVRRYVYAEYGNDPSGAAVFRESFVRSFHTKPTLDPVPYHPIFVGQDFGRDPWSIIGQLDHKGRLLILEEVPANDVGLEQHINENLRPRLLSDRYKGLPVAMIGDPAGRAKSSIHEETSFDALRRLGFNAFPAPTNDIDPRLRAVEMWLNQSRGGEAGMLFDASRCPQLIQGMAGGYRFAKDKRGQKRPKPEKNEFSHSNDALQYLCLAGQKGFADVVTRHLLKPKRGGPVMPVSAWT